MAIISTVDTLGDAALTDSIINRSIAEYTDGYITTVRHSALRSCTNLAKINFPAVTHLSDYAFSECTSLTTADFSSVATINNYVFQNCSALTALIIRSNTVPSLINTTVFSGTPIESGTGYIYVPAALVDSYKTALVWKTYANQIRAIEDYPEVCSWLGKVWYIRTDETPPYMTYNNGIYHMRRNNRLYYSEDANSWYECPGSTMYDSDDIVYHNGIWVAAVTSSSSYYKGIIYSEDGKTWTKSDNTTGYFNDIAVGNRFVLSGNVVSSAASSGLLYSEDGKTWTQSNITSGTFYITYSNVASLWVAASTSTLRSGFWYSEDGKTWTQSNKTSGYGLGSAAIKYFNGLWCIGAGDGLYYSEDGKTWTQSNITSGAVRAINYHNGVWALAHGSSGVWYSENGKTWTMSNYTEGDAWTMTVANGVWFVTHGNGSHGVWYSNDGKTWYPTILTKNYLTTTIRSVFYINGVLYMSKYYTKEAH